MLLAMHLILLRWTHVDTVTAPFHRHHHIYSMCCVYIPIKMDVCLCVCASYVLIFFVYVNMRHVIVCMCVRVCVTYRLSFRELRCLRNSIHANLFFTYIMSGLLWILTLSVQVCMYVYIVYVYDVGILDWIIFA